MYHNSRLRNRFGRYRRISATSVCCGSGISSDRKGIAPDADRRCPDPSLGKRNAVPATSPGAVLRRAGDRRDGRSRRGPGADPSGAVGPGLERAGAGGGAAIPRPLRDHGLVLSRRPERPRPCRALEGAAGHARSALLFQRAAQAGMDDRRHARLAVARGRAGRRAGGARRRVVPADRRPDRRAPPRAEADRRSHGRAAGEHAASPPTASSPNCWRSPNTPTSRSRRPASPATRKTPIRSAASTSTCTASSTRSARIGCSGAPTSRGCLVPGGNA